MLSSYYCVNHRYLRPKVPKELGQAEKHRTSDHYLGNSFFKSVVTPNINAEFMMSHYIGKI